MASAGSAGSPLTDKVLEKRVLAAYLRMLGATQKDAGAAVGRSERTVQAWEADREGWAQARAEASARWLDDVLNASRATVLAAIRAGDAELALKMVERLVPELAPPKTKLELNIPWDSLNDEQLRRLAAGEHPTKVLSLWHTNGSTPTPE